MAEAEFVSNCVVARMGKLPLAKRCLDESTLRIVAFRLDCFLRYNMKRQGKVKPFGEEQTYEYTQPTLSEI